MTTAVDTNVIIALWDDDPKLSGLAQLALDGALARGTIVLSGPVFAELLAAPSRNENFVDSFLRETGLTVEYTLEERIWRAAGRAYRAYAVRRRMERDSGPRRILADFLIGAHASERGYQLLTLDSGLFEAAFPKLGILSP
jgi:hypothetical protein